MLTAPHASAWMFALALTACTSSSTPEAAQADIVRRGAGDDGGGELFSCDPRKVVCKRVAPSCAAFEAPIVVDGCYGECVPIERCACDSAEACPDENRFTCHRYAAHCGPYVH